MIFHSHSRRGEEGIVSGLTQDYRPSRHVERLPRRTDQIRSVLVMSGETTTDRDPTETKKRPSTLYSFIFKRLL